ncbi:hypothetical protein [Bradyrhizobium sp. I71]|uniref:hypothetical protein n=1 Tax=Bradyrhizobium sp. I71 TaxID=2590772 RepID=UPI001EF9093D|nr:hypothetical protein [Bradyrhizobium sp. I71]ULK95971.1 hypothetical protein FJV43_24865 [Bradyrhizobium sp. I71]
MNAQAKELIIKELLDEIQQNLRSAKKSVMAAKACTDAGSISQAVQVSMELDQTIYDLGRLHDAVTLLGRSPKVGRT